MKTFKRVLSGSAATAMVFGISATIAHADQVILDDLIVDGSACIGQDCVNGESFGFDTLRLKENNLRLHFQDTSNSASFPTSDWRIVINDSSNGGSNYFGVEDSDAGRIPFRVESGAPSNSLFVEDSGQVGLGTNNPVADIHILSGNTPTVRLEQDGSSGFTPQTWDLAGNEANFFIRDATNGSTLPFRLFPGAPSNALSIEASGDIGLGTTSPSSSLHVRRTNGTAQLFIEEVNSTEAQRDLLQMTNTGSPRFRMTAKDPAGTVEADWVFAVLDTDIFRITNVGNGQTEFELNGNGNLTIAGQLTTSGSCSVGCDRVFDADYEMPTISEHAEYMFANRHLPAVGPTVEGQPMNITRKVEGILNELEKAHIYIAQLEERLNKMEDTKR